jgi:hypothetical protein
MARRILFRVITPLGYAVMLTRNRWREIVRYKHPAVAQHQKGVRQCLQAPDVVRCSAADPDVHLYYLHRNGRHLCVVVAGTEAADEDRFVVTAYFTKRVKPGNALWTR